VWIFFKGRRLSERGGGKGEGGRRSSNIESHPREISEEAVICQEATAGITFITVRRINVSNEAEQGKQAHARDQVMGRPIREGRKWFTKGKGKKKSKKTQEVEGLVREGGEAYSGHGSFLGKGIAKKGKNDKSSCTAGGQV